MELIETLWNVNAFFPTMQKSQLRELIETLWNVNDDKRGGTDVHDKN